MVKKNIEKLYNPHKKSEANMNFYCLYFKINFQLVTPLPTTICTIINTINTLSDI